jgi:hypothetical protein
MFLKSIRAGHKCDFQFALSFFFVLGTFMPVSGLLGPEMLFLINPRLGHNNGFSIRDGPT